jgi:hypothetical protein
MTIDFSELFSVLFAFRLELLLVALLIVGVILIALLIVGVILILRGSSDSKPHSTLLFSAILLCFAIYRFIGAYY